MEATPRAGAVGQYGRFDPHITSRHIIVYSNVFYTEVARVTRRRTRLRARASFPEQGPLSTWECGLWFSLGLVGMVSRWLSLLTFRCIRNGSVCLTI